MRASEKGRDLIREAEALRVFAYPDPESPLAKATPGKRWGFRLAQEILDTLAPEKVSLDGSPWTVGYGQTKNVTKDSVMSAGQADADLVSSLGRYERLVSMSCTRIPTQNQFDALVCLAWNCEVAVSKTSSIIKAHNRGDFAAAAKAFTLYNKSRGKVVEGLTSRRRKESMLYLTPDDEGQPIDPMTLVSAQAVDAPKTLMASKINIAQASTATIATLTGANEALKTVGDFKESVTGLGEWLVPIACVAVVALCLFTIWQRYDLRKRGVV